MSVELSSVPTLAPGHRLQWEAAQQTHVLLFPEGMVTLNQPAWEILDRCDGHRTVAEIVSELERCFEQPGLESDVMEFLQVAGREGWIRGG